jgi:hypothetical protein
MLLAALRNIILAMRRSWTEFSSGRDVAGLVAVGQQHANVHYPRFAAQIGANALSMTTVLEVAAAAIINEAAFSASLGTSGLVLSKPYLAFFDNTLAQAL